MAHYTIIHGFTVSKSKLDSLKNLESVTFFDEDESIVSSLVENGYLVFMPKDNNLPYEIYAPQLPFSNTDRLIALSWLFYPLCTNICYDDKQIISFQSLFLFSINIASIL